MRSFLKNAALLTFSFLLLVFILELVFRIFRSEDALKLSMGQTHLKYLHSLQPNSELHLISEKAGEFDVIARINNFGFRGPDIKLEKQPGQKRIFVVGDSFVFGVGARDHETIPALLQQKLDPDAKSIEIVNMGHGHYSPLTHYLRLRDEIPKLKPDLVVMMLDFSDLRDDWEVEKHLVYDAGGHILGSNPYYEYGKFNLWDYLRSKSVLASYLHNKVVRTFRKIQKLGFRSYLETRLRGMKAKAAIATTKENTIEFDGRLFMRGSAKAEEIQKHFERTGKYILMCRDLVREAGALFILVMYPYGTYVGPDQWGEGRVFWGFEKGKVVQDYFAFNLVKRFANEHSIPFVNLLDDFLAAKDRPLFFPFDGHFTPEGNRVVAEGLERSPVFQETIARLRSS